MPTPPGDANVYLQLGLAAIGGSGLGAFIQSLRKPSSMAEVIKAAQDAAVGVIKELRDEVGRLTTRCEASESAHRDCEERVAALWQRVTGQPLPPYQPDQPRNGAPEDQA